MKTFIVESGVFLPPVLRDYIVFCVRKADPGSEFEEKTRKIRGMSDDLIVPTLLQADYGGILFVNGQDVVGHVFFQQRGLELHAFSFRMRPDMRGQRRWHEMMRSLHGICRDRALKLLCMTKGGNEITMHMWNSIRDGKVSLPFKALEDRGVGWLEPLAA